jgi:hypothetical protein
MAFAPDEAAAIQSEGRLIVASTAPPEVAVAQAPGFVPLRISSEQDVPFVDSIASSLAFLVATLN